MRDQGRHRLDEHGAGLARHRAQRVAKRRGARRVALHGVDVGLLDEQGDRPRGAHPRHEVPERRGVVHGRGRPAPAPRSSAGSPPPSGSGCSSARRSRPHGERRWGRNSPGTWISHATTAPTATASATSDGDLRAPVPWLGDGARRPPVRARIRVVAVVVRDRGEAPASIRETSACERNHVRRGPGRARRPTAPAPRVRSAQCARPRLPDTPRQLFVPGNISPGRQADNTLILRVLYVS